jgi:hypothetical protein
MKPDNKPMFSVRHPMHYLTFTACIQHASAGAAPGSDSQSANALPAVSGANQAAVSVMQAIAIKKHETGHVSPPDQFISMAATSGVRPPEIAPPNWHPSDAPL